MTGNKFPHEVQASVVQKTAFQTKLYFPFSMKQRETEVKHYFRSSKLDYCY